MSLLLLVIASAGAAGFITRLITQDDITDWLRDRWKVFWIKQLGPRHPWNRPGVGKAQKFIACHRCVGSWVTGALFTLAWASGGADWFWWPAMSMAAAFAISVALDAVSR